jgi:hypothetical protein
MLAICQAESGGNTNATNYNYNGTTDRGVLQVNSSHAYMVNGDLNSLYDPAVNISIAYRIWLGQSYQAWSSYNSGSYERFYL